MVDKIVSSNLMVYLMMGTGFLGTFITINLLLQRDWNNITIYSSWAALAFINVLWIDKERKRRSI